MEIVISEVVAWSCSVKKFSEEFREVESTSGGVSFSLSCRPLVRAFRITHSDFAELFRVAILQSCNKYLPV